MAQHLISTEPSQDLGPAPQPDLAFPAIRVSDAMRRRATMVETTDLFDMARRQALLRWRGLTPDRSAH